MENTKKKGSPRNKMDVNGKLRENGDQKER